MAETRQIKYKTSSSGYDSELEMDGEIYRPRHTLGSGTSAIVRFFGNDQKKGFAIKKPRDNCKYTIEPFFNIECKFYNIGYPDIVCNVVRIGRESRLLMDCLPPMLGDALLKMRSADDVRHLIYAVAKELQRLHDLQIIHGDITLENILIDLTIDSDSVSINRVIFIDFAWAYSATADATTITENNIALHWAPERRKPASSVKADVSQDVYSFGHMILKDFRAFLRVAYPHVSHNQFLSYLSAATTGLGLESSLERVPSRRPKLSNIIDNLERELKENKSMCLIC